MRRSTAVHLKWKPLTLLCLISIILLITAFKLYSSVGDDNIETSLQQHGQGFEEDAEQLVEKLQDGEKLQVAKKVRVDENTKEKKIVKKDEYILWDQSEGKSDPAGPGENGVGVKFAPEENAKVEQSYSQYGFNQYISDQISLHRSLSDPRPKQ